MFEISVHDIKTVFNKRTRLLIDMLAKLRKATIDFVMSVCPSVWIEQLGSHWTDFHEI
jgi:hypothetical protein